MKPALHPSLKKLYLGSIATALAASLSLAQDKAETKTEIEKEPSSQQAANPSTSRVFLTNGDRLSGQPQSINEQGDLIFDSDSLRQTAKFPTSTVLSLEFNNWGAKDRPDTLARVTLQPRWHETSNDSILGQLHELTPESIKLKTWYGGIISIKRSMVKSLQVIHNTPGSYFGPNNLKEWTLSGGKGSWKFANGALVSRASGGIGRDIGLHEKTHVSFDITWESSMRFHMLLYSSDITKDRPKAYYDINFSSNYAYLRTYGNVAKRGQFQGARRWPQIRLNPDTKRAHFDIFAHRKDGTFSIYINGIRACLLQSLSPDPKDLGTGLSFIADQKHPIQISGLTVTRWNGTSLPNQANTIPSKQEENPDKEDDDESKQDLPHTIILNNGDEVPCTVGKVLDGRMIIETKYTPIRIPIKRIKSLSLGDTEDEPKKYPDDIRAWFHHGGFITLKLNSFKNNQLNGYSQAFGDVTLDLSAFARLDFHIYDLKANAMRNKLR